MSFKEQLERYQRGESTAEEAALVEEELAKYRLLTDYAVENDDPGPDLPPSEPEGDPAALKKVRRAVRRHRIGLILGAALLACVLVFALGQVYRWAVLPLVNQVLFLDPESDAIFGDDISDLHVAMGIFEELYHPGCGTVMVGSETTGLWKYDISVYRHNALSDTPSMYWLEGTLDKGRLTLKDGYQSVLGNGWFTRDSEHTREVWDGREPGRVTEELGKLPEYVQAYLNLSFDRDLSMEELVGLMEANPEMRVLWVGVRGTLPVGGLRPTMGFSPTGLNFAAHAMEEKYPYLMVNEHKGEDRAVVFTEHYKALLRFQAEHGELMDAIGGAGWEKPFFGRVGKVGLEDAEQNGVNTYGIVVSGRAADLQPLCEMDFIEEIAVLRLALSLDTYE